MIQLGAGLFASGLSLGVERGRAPLRGSTAGYLTTEYFLRAGLVRANTCYLGSKAEIRHSWRHRLLTADHLNSASFVANLSSSDLDPALRKQFGKPFAPLD